MPNDMDPAESIPPEVCRRIIAARDAMADGLEDEAFHQLYLIADPGLNKADPWRELEIRAAVSTGN